MTLGVFSPDDARMVLNTCRAIRKLGIIEQWKSAPGEVDLSDKPLYCVNRDTTHISQYSPCMAIGVQYFAGALSLIVIRPTDPIGYANPVFFTENYIGPGQPGVLQRGPTIKVVADNSPGSQNILPGDSVAFSTTSGAVFKQRGGAMRYIGDTYAVGGGNQIAICDTRSLGMSRYIFETTEQFSNGVAKCNIWYADNITYVRKPDNSPLNVGVWDPLGTFSSVPVGHKGYCDQHGNYFTAVQAPCP